MCVCVWVGVMDWRWEGFEQINLSPSRTHLTPLTTPEARECSNDTKKRWLKLQTELAPGGKWGTLVGGLALLSILSGERLRELINWLAVRTITSVKCRQVFGYICA